MAAPGGQQAGGGIPGVEASAAPTDAGQAQPGWGPMGYVDPNSQMQVVPMMNPAQYMMPPQAGTTGAGAAQGFSPGMMMPGMPQGMMQMMMPLDLQQMTAQQAAMANGGGWNGMQGINQSESGGKSARAGRGMKAQCPRTGDADVSPGSVAPLLSSRQPEYQASAAACRAVLQQTVATNKQETKQPKQSHFNATEELNANHTAEIDRLTRQPSRQHAAETLLLQREIEAAYPMT